MTKDVIIRRTVYGLDKQDLLEVKELMTKSSIEQLESIAKMFINECTNRRDRGCKY